MSSEELKNKILKLTPINKVRVVIVAHTNDGLYGQAGQLAFSTSRDRQPTKQGQRFLRYIRGRGYEPIDTSLEYLSKDYGVMLLNADFLSDKDIIELLQLVKDNKRDIPVVLFDSCYRFVDSVQFGCDIRVSGPYVTYGNQVDEVESGLSITTNPLEAAERKSDVPLVWGIRPKHLFSLVENENKYEPIQGVEYEYQY